MRDRDWIHAVSADEKTQRASVMQQHMEQRLRDMEAWTDEECERLKLIARNREAAEAAWRRAVLRRRYLVIPRHTPIERSFLRMMIKFMIAESPNLAERAVDLARYLSAEYAFEWVLCPCTRIARAEARALMLHAAESEFGETPMARPVAYVQYHWRQYEIRDVANLGECLTMAMFLDQHHHFLCNHVEWRNDLGLQRHALQREIRARSDAEQAGEGSSSDDLP
jgi:hypothetical protein